MEVHEEIVIAPSVTVEVDYFEDGRVFLEICRENQYGDVGIVALNVAEARAVGTALLAAAAEKAFDESEGARNE